MDGSPLTPNSEIATLSDILSGGTPVLSVQHHAWGEWFFWARRSYFLHDVAGAVPVVIGPRLRPHRVSRVA